MLFKIRSKTMKKLSLIIIGLFYVLSYSALSTELSDQESQDYNQLLKEVLKVSAIYNTPMKDEVHHKEAKRSMSRVINNLEYDVVRYNHGLAHAVRQAYLVKQIVHEMLKLEDETNALGNFLKKEDPKTISPFIKKLQLLALYYRAGRENEFSPSGGTEEEKARFDENMRAGAELFKNAAQESNLFENDDDINNFAEALYHYEYKRNEKEFNGITRYIDQIVYAAHLLDLRRVTAPWNKPPDGPQEILPEISEILGFSGDVNNTVKTLDNISEKYLKATGDRDAWDYRRTLSDEFFFQAYAPELMLIKLNQVQL